MNIPNYKEITLNYSDLDTLENQLKQYQIGDIPYFIRLPEDVSLVELKEIIEHLSRAILSINKCPFFPYPTYLITDKAVNIQDFPSVHSERKLPKYYRCPIKRPSNKEAKLLNKIDMYKETLRPIDLVERIDALNFLSLSNKKLFELVTENRFLESLHDNLILGHRDD